MGTAGEMMLTPFGSMIVGFLAGIISVLGFKFFSVRLINHFIFFMINLIELIKVSLQIRGFKPCIFNQAAGGKNGVY